MNTHPINGSKRPPISLAHTQQQAQTRQQVHAAMQSIEEHTRQRAERQRQALRAAYTAGMQLSQRENWWRGFFPGVMVGTGLGATAALAVYWAIQLGLQP